MAQAFRTRVSSTVKPPSRAKAYSKLREDLEDKLPKLPKESTPEQITAHKKTFQGMVRSARAGARTA